MSVSVVHRICEELRAQIEHHALPAGTRMLSVRQLARERKISTFTASEIYNVLVAAGVLEARPGRGYFVPDARAIRNHGLLLPRYAADALWEHRREARGRIKVDAGCGWLPGEWLDSEGIRQALRALARTPQLSGDGYGNPYGLAALRSHLASQLQRRGIDAAEDQIVLTHGASHALDLIVRYCLTPGDSVVVEDPGYPPLFELLRARGVKLLPIPRSDAGPDVDVLERLLKSRQPRLIFTNTTCQNPTGTTTRASVAHRIVQLANKFGCDIVEDDIFGELAPRNEGSLASLDQMEKVCYVSSLSKTISPDLRVGYLVASRTLAAKLARGKAMCSLATSELMEHLALNILTHPHHRRNLERLRRRLDAAQAAAKPSLEAHGVELAYQPQSGMFLWGKLPSELPVGKLWQLALQSEVLLAPGELFRASGEATPYWRFNVAHCHTPRLYEFLDTLRAA